MWIQVRTFDGKKSIRVDDLSKLTKIEELREKLVDPFDASPERQRLFYRGKQLEDGHTLFDYNVGLNDLIQLMVRNPDPVKEDERTNGYVSSSDEGSSDKENKRPPTPELIKSSNSKQYDEEEMSSSTYKVGDIIDARDESVGAWFESRLVRVTKATDHLESSALVTDGLQNETVKNESNNSQKDATNIESKIDSDESEGRNKSEITKINDILTEKDIVVNGNADFSEPMEMDASETGSQDDNKHVDGDSDKSLLKTLHPNEVIHDDGFVYHVVFDRYDEDEPLKLKCKDIRPRARNIIPFKELKEGQKVMVNYNIDDPDQRGLWYDSLITKKKVTRTVKELLATVYFGPDLTPLENCKILFVGEIFDIEKAGTQLNEADVANNPAASPVKRQVKPECDHCLDNPRKKCKHCACCICGGKHDPDKQIICDECNQAYHLSCLTPPLDKLPEEDEWYCPSCKNDVTEIVKAGEKLKESKKKSKMASSSSTSGRDWGRGMACVGRTKVCTVVPSNHFGSIPGVEVGTLWKFRVQVSEAGVHRPHVAGIHGREDEGAYSVVLSGGYEDDTDNGDEFHYTGSGGRDLSGNKRTAEQSCDQMLTRMNKALAKNCNAPLDSKKGAEAKDWKAGKPVRVVRNCKGRKHSDYSPEEGNRYDGIYKIVKYWPEKGKSGFLVWRYMLKRDDPTPAPWTTAGKKKIKELGLAMQYPEGYLEAQAQKEKSGDSPNIGKGKVKGKRKRAEEQEDGHDSAPKNIKVAAYKIGSEQSKLIKEDKANKKLWDEALSHTKKGGQAFLQTLEELFNCICCQEVVLKPITTQCAHNFCKACLQRSFKAGVYSCPACRTDLEKDLNSCENKTLGEILSNFFPGYEAGR
ncbi:hypothetical protein ACJMK2_030501 [Sinanodonta woodiana]|uniref:RING-type E3 ubiquitin transferase n=1 Tax=Sinanodonta woodiana TaxID=1069815 RepID=A0ABD3WX91_SINWO